MSISKLDVILLGRKALPTRLQSLETSIGSLPYNQFASEGVSTTEEIRPNLIINSSFEFYNAGPTPTPNDWVLPSNGVTLNLNAAGADGNTSITLAPGTSISQTIAGGTSLANGAYTAHVAARALSAGCVMGISVTHTTGCTISPVYRLDIRGFTLQSNEVLSNTEWQRMYVKGVLSGGAPVTITFTNISTSPATLEFDAAKFEYTPGDTTPITPSAYQGSDWGGSTSIRNLRAENIVAGTLTVGGPSSDDPRIIVLDGTNQEIVSIGDPTDGFYGIHVKHNAGIRVSGTGSVEVQGGGGIAVSGGGNVSVVGGGAISVGAGGRIYAGTSNAQRTEITEAGLAGYNAAQVKQVEVSSATGKLHIYGPGSVVVEGGGSIIAGTLGGSRLELGVSGIHVYDTFNTQKVAIDTSDAKVRIDADAFLVDGMVTLDSLQILGELTLGQDLRIGTNILFVDQSQMNVGINRAPDVQFDLDVAGSIRSGGYFVGKHAIQLADATLICHYDGAGKIGTDLTGEPNGHRGQVPTIQGTVTYPQGKFNKGIQLGTTNGYLRYVDTSIVTGSAGMCTLWVYPTGLGTTAQYLFKTGATINSNAIALKCTQTATTIEYAGNTSALVAGALTPNVWQHLAVTWSGNSLVLYKNGIQIGTATSGSTPIDYGYPMYVGGTGGANATFQGIIDDFVVLNRTPSSTEIRAVVESNAPVFAETSNWGFRTANTLAWADAEGLWAMNNTGVAAFGVSGVDAKSWGQKTLDRGDVLIGANSDYVFWDASAAKLSIAGQMVVGGPTNYLWLNDTADGSLAIGGATKASAPFRVSAAGALTATNANITGVITATSGSFSGTITATSGSITGTLTVYSGGKFYAAGGNVYISDTLNIVSSSTGYDQSNWEPAKSIVFKNSDNTANAGYLSAVDTPSIRGLTLTTLASGTKLERITFLAGTYLSDFQNQWGRIVINANGAANSSIEISAATVSIPTNFVLGKDAGSTGLLWGNSRVTKSLRVGLPSYDPSGTTSLSVQGAIVAGGYMHPGNQIDYGWTYAANAWSTGYNVVYCNGSVGVEGLLSNGWLRTIGATGWFSQSYGGGIWMQNTTTVEIYGGKHFNVPTGNVAIRNSINTGIACLVKGIGTTSGTYSLYLQNNAASDMLRIRDDGNLWNVSAWANTSDSRLKNHIQPLTNALTTALSIPVKTFYQTNALQGIRQTGVIAQEIIDIIPDSVQLQEDGYYSVRYQNISMLTLAALQEAYTSLKEELDTLKTFIRERLS